MTIYVSNPISAAAPAVSSVRAVTGKIQVRIRLRSDSQTDAVKNTLTPQAQLKPLLSMFRCLSFPELHGWCLISVPSPASCIGTALFLTLFLFSLPMHLSVMQWTVEMRRTRCLHPIPFRPERQNAPRAVWVYIYTQSDQPRGALGTKETSCNMIAFHENDAMCLLGLLSRVAGGYLGRGPLHTSLLCLVGLA